MEKTIDFDHDVTASLWRRKRRALEGARLGVIVPSEWMGEQVNASRAFEDGCIALVNNVVDTDVFSPSGRAAARTEFGIEADAQVVLFVGKPDDATAYRGRHPVMLDALTQLHQRVGPGEASRIVVLIVGAGGEALSGHLGGIRSICLGAVDGEKAMSRVFAASDVYLNTTQYDNFPAVVQEAFACGLPVVASAVGGIPEMVVPAQTGMLCVATDAGSFADAMGRLFMDEHFRRRMGVRARRFAEEHFSPTVIVPAMLSAYARAAESKFASGGIYKP
jgi:glycosyltransferase involved in cell wall biosynthesis